MSVTELDISQIRDIIEPLLGAQAWSVSLGVGSFITLEFGAPLLSSVSMKHPHGEWHLWIEHCAWRLEERSEVLAGSEDPRSLLRTAVKRIEGRKLQSVTIVPPALETSLSFEGGLTLRLFPIYSTDYENWELFTPGGNVLCIGPGASWRYQSSNES